LAKEIDLQGKVNGLRKNRAQLGDLILGLLNDRVSLFRADISFLQFVEGGY
jgi:hypothetical protein